MMTRESEIVVQASPGSGFIPVDSNRHQQRHMQQNQQQQFQQWQQQQEFQRFLMFQQSQNQYQTASQYQPQMTAMHNSNNSVSPQDQTQFQEFLQWKHVQQQQQQQQQQQTSDNSIMAAPAAAATATGTTSTSTSKTTSRGGGCARSALESGCGVFTIVNTATSTMDKVTSQQEKLSSSFGQMQSAWEKTRDVIGSCAGVVEKFV